MQRETVDTPVKVFAVMPKTFEAGEPAGAGAGEVVVPRAAALARRTSGRRAAAQGGRRPSTWTPPRASWASVAGFGKREDLPIGEQLAAALEAELGCTKSLADFQWLPEDRIIGLSGAKTKPDLYLAVGISGQIQHTVGISSAKLIAAVNKDKEAPIFALADYGIVGDLYQVVPALIERLKAL